jgi:hypothetical protein
LGGILWSCGKVSHLKKTALKKKYLSLRKGQLFNTEKVAEFKVLLIKKKKKKERKKKNTKFNQV